jgi:ribosomal protein S18 acetylase RimI-like enzyme
VTIRPGAAEDVAAVLPLVARTIAFHEQLDEARFGAVPDAYRRYEGWFTSMAGTSEGAFFVAEQDGRIVGFVFGQIQEEYKMYRLNRYGMLHDLWVEPAYRRRGAAKALIRAVLDRFRQAGVTQARLDSGAGNEAAQRLFAACGFRPSVLEMLAEL